MRADVPPPCLEGGGTGRTALLVGGEGPKLCKSIEGVAWGRRQSLTMQADTLTGAVREGGRALSAGGLAAVSWQARCPRVVLRVSGRQGRREAWKVEELR